MNIDRDFVACIYIGSRVSSLWLAEWCATRIFKRQIIFFQILGLQLRSNGPIVSFVLKPNKTVCSLYLRCSSYV